MFVSFCHVFFMIKEKEKKVLWQDSSIFDLNSNYSIQYQFAEDFNVINFVQPVINNKFLYLTDLDVEYPNYVKIQVLVNYSIFYDVIQVKSYINYRTLLIKPKSLQVQITQSQELYLQAVKLLVHVKLINTLQKSYYPYFTTQNENQMTYQFQSDLFSRLSSGMRQIWIEIYYQPTPDIKITESLQMNEIELQEYQQFVGTSQIMIFPNAVNIKTAKMENFDQFYKDLVKQKYEQIFIRLVINIIKDGNFLQLSRIFEFQISIKDFADGDISCYCSEMVDPQSCYLYTNSLQYIEENSFYGFITYQFINKTEKQFVISMKDTILNYCGISTNLVLIQEHLFIDVKTSNNSQLCHHFDNQSVNLFVHLLSNGSHYQELVNAESVFQVSYKFDNTDQNVSVKLSRAQIKEFKNLTLVENKAVSIQLKNDTSLLATTFPVLINFSEDSNDDSILITMVLLLTCVLCLLTVVIIFVCIQNRGEILSE